MPSGRPLPADGPYSGITPHIALPKEGVFRALPEREFQKRGSIGLRNRKSPFQQTGNALSEDQSNFRRSQMRRTTQNS
jgi:hypothetical protein